MSRTQNERILVAMRGAGRRGITRVDFQAPNVIDGGDIIINFPARIQNLEELGHEIVVTGRRNKCNVYVLASVLGEGAGTPSLASSPNTSLAHRRDHCGACGKRIRRIRTAYSGTVLCVDDPRAPDGWATIIDHGQLVAVDNQGRAALVHDNLTDLVTRGCRFFDRHQCAKDLEVAA